MPSIAARPIPPLAHPATNTTHTTTGTTYATHTTSTTQTSVHILPCCPAAMVTCESCKDWFHARCVGVSQTHMRSMRRYTCPICAAVKVGGCAAAPAVCAALAARLGRVLPRPGPGACLRPCNVLAPAACGSPVSRRPRPHTRRLSAPPPSFPGPFGTCNPVPTFGSVPCPTPAGQHRAAGGGGCQAAAHQAARARATGGDAPRALRAAGAARRGGDARPPAQEI